MSRPATNNADALDASVRLAKLRKKMFAQVEMPRIAQYHLRHKIGGGGMGLVFAALDPSLDRQVAIKVLRDAWSDGAGEQLRREALALARLRHPAVVSVFEVGEHEGQVYLVMEYVEGETLRAWAQRWRQTEPRDNARLIDVFEQAARGLAAAHEADVVHRDVKPENIMVDTDGRTRLMDFGLARRAASAEITQRDGADTRPSRESHSTLGLFGTPAYMAPEQVRGLSAGPAADQFGLAACMYEVLSGRRVRPDFESAEVVLDFDGVRRFEALLRRALEDEPEARFESMEAFADAIAQARPKPKQRTALWFGGLVAVAFGAFLAADVPKPCTGSEEQIDAVWSSTRAQATAEAVVDPAKPWTDSAWSRVHDRLDAYGQRWATVHRSTCEAARVHQEISDAQMDQRMACLADRRQHLDAFASLLLNEGTAALPLADEGLDALPDLEACTDPAYVGRQGYPSRNEDTADTVGAQLAEAATLQARGAPERARDIAREALAVAQRSNDEAAEARALLAVGKAHATLTELRDAEARLIEAYERARTIPLPDVAAEAAVELSWVTGLALSRFDEGRWWLRIADLESRPLHRGELDLERNLVAVELLHEAGQSNEAQARAEQLRKALPELDPRARARVELRLGWLLLQTKDHEGGTAQIEVAARLLAEALGDQHPANAKAHKQLAFAARVRGDMPLALSHARRALELAESGVSPRHVSLAPFLSSLAIATFQQGDVEAAVAAIDRGLQLDEPYPLETVTRAKLYGRRGDILIVHDVRGALEAQTQAYTLAREAIGEQHRDTVSYLVARGRALGDLGRSAEAEEAMRTGLLLGTAVLGTHHPNLGAIHGTLAQQYQRQGDLERALEEHRASLQIWENTYGPESYALVAPLTNICGALGMSGRASEALPSCDRALRIHEARDADRTMSSPDIHNNRGIALYQLERYDEAQAEFRLARAAWQQVLGPGTYEESIVIANLAELAELHGNRERAAELYAEALEIRRAKLGEDHPALAVPREGLARVTR